MTRPRPRAGAAFFAGAVDAFPCFDVTLDLAAASRSKDRDAKGFFFGSGGGGAEEEEEDLRA